MSDETTASIGGLIVIVVMAAIDIIKAKVLASKPERTEPSQAKLNGYDLIANLRSEIIRLRTERNDAEDKFDKIRQTLRKMEDEYRDRLKDANAKASLSQEKSMMQADIISSLQSEIKILQASIEKIRSTAGTCNNCRDLIM
jgi:chromosome segregation ATPase